MKQVFQDRFDAQLQIEDTQAYALTFAPHSTGSVYVRVSSGLLDMELLASAYSETTVFLDIQSKQALQSKIQVQAQEGAWIHVVVLDVEKIPATYKIQGEHFGSEAHIEIHSATLAAADKKWNMEILHRYPYTYGIMENYCVVEDDVRCEVEAIGNIKSGAHDSVSHQKTRVLTMSERHQAQVTPILYIDENEVKASHAMTLGQPDGDQLYYLQTRGLNKEMALGLLSIGYFLPIIERITNSELREEVKCRVEEKVGLYGHREHS